jgi:hypothetical protein
MEEQSTMTKTNYLAQKVGHDKIRGIIGRRYLLSQEEREKIKKATLAWCNKIRVKLGKQPVCRLPKGERFDSSSCPCGKVTGLEVGRLTAQRKGKQFKTTKDVFLFTYLFDYGYLPELEKEDSKPIIVW